MQINPSSNTPINTPSGQRSNKPILLIGALVLLVILISIVFFWLNNRRGLPFTLPSPEASAPPNIERTKLEGQIVAGFPDIAPFPSSTLVYSTAKQNEPNPSYEAIWKTPENIDIIVAWYNENLPQDNWVIESAPDVPGTFEQSFIAQKDNLKLYLTIETSESGQETEIIADIITVPTN